MKKLKVSPVTKDISLVGLVTIMSIGANLPEGIMAQIGINQTYLLIGLVAVVAVSLVRYLKFTLVLVIAIMAVGANLPNDLAQELGVDPLIMMYALVAMVATSFINFLIKLPKGVKPIAQINSAHTVLAPSATPPLFPYPPSPFLGPFVNQSLLRAHAQ